jgi:topoisomerase-4 subunit A
MGTNELYFLSSDFAYGFISNIDHLIAKGKAGKSILTLPEGSQPLTPVKIQNLATDYLAMVSSAGYLWIVAANVLPQRLRGKGSKIMNIPLAKLSNLEEKIVSVVVLPANSSLLIHAGKRYKRLKGRDLLAYQGDKGRRGKQLPQGYQNVSHLAVESI